MATSLGTNKPSVLQKTKQQKKKLHIQKNFVSLQIDNRIPLLIAMGFNLLIYILM
jgi:hypothetical protein